MKHAASPRGFTLLEVLLASIIGAFIALVAVGALRAVTAGRTLVYRNIAAADELRYALEQIRTDLENIYRDTDSANFRFVGGYIESADDLVTSLRMRIISNAPARRQQPESDVYEVEYFLASPEDLADPEAAPSLMRRLCPIVGNEIDELTQGGMLTAIAKNIVAFEVRYFDGLEWLPEWPLERNAFPQMVEVILPVIESDQHGRQIPTTRTMLATFPRLPGSAQQAAAQRAVQGDGL